MEETEVHFGPDMRDQIVHLSQMLICNDIYTYNRILCLNMMLFTSDLCFFYNDNA